MNILYVFSDVNRGEGTSADKWKKGKILAFSVGAPSNDFWIVHSLHLDATKKAKLLVWLFDRKKEVYMLQAGLATINIPSSILGISLVE
jgi:hypothetical protein